MQSLDAFIEIFIYIGQGFIVVCGPLGLLLLAGWGFYKVLRRNLSCLDKIGWVIMFFVILIPFAAVGAFCGELANILFKIPVKHSVAWVGFFVGGYLGLRTWDWLVSS
ncbi:MAG: hypothetical protein GY796_10210 [Chloroflexi bacterium]|nr:hypothetical protein [Chloroflexota bacterium]